MIHGQWEYTSNTYTSFHSKVPSYSRHYTWDMNTMADSQVIKVVIYIAIFGTCSPIYWERSSEIKAWINNHIQFYLNCYYSSIPNRNAIYLLLKLGHGCMITSHSFVRMLLLIHALILKLVWLIPVSEWCLWSVSTYVSKLIYSSSSRRA